VGSGKKAARQQETGLPLGRGVGGAREVEEEEEAREEVRMWGWVNTQDASLMSCGTRE
jgi:hypothetical protein